MYAFIDITPSTGADMVYQLKTLLVAQGWVVLDSGDGLALYGAGSDIIASGSSGAGGLGNTAAWFRITSPDGQIEFTVQRGVINYAYRIKYSRNDKFVGLPSGGGATDANTTPSATDEQTLLGGGSDAVPSYANAFPLDGQYRCKIGSDDASPYTFYVVTNQVGVASCNSAWILDACTDMEATDAEPYAHYLANSSPLQYSSLESAAAAPLTFYPSATPSVFGRFPCMTMDGAGNRIFPQAAGTNPINKKTNLASIWLARRAFTQTYPGYKGKLTMMRWSGTLLTSGHPLSEASANDLIVYGDVVLPFGGTIPAT